MNRINMTLDNETLALLDRIGEQIGSDNRSAVVRFLARQYKGEESKTMEDEYKGWSAILRYDDDSIFGSLTDSDPEMEGVDREASARRYGEDITKAVETQYPGMEVSVEYGPYAGKSVIVSVPESAMSETTDVATEAEMDILGVMSDVFERGGWII